MHTYTSQSPRTLCKRFTETEAAAEKHRDETETTKILSNLACLYKEHCSCSSTKDTYSSVTTLHMLYMLILQIYLSYAELNPIFYLSQVGGKNIPFTLDKLHPEIRENKMSLKGPQQSTSLFFTTVKQLLTWLLMDKVLHNITVLHPTYTVQRGGHQQMEHRPIAQCTLTEA